VKGQPEKMSLEPCFKLTATDGWGVKVSEVAVSSRQLELWWRSSIFRVQLR